MPWRKISNIHKTQDLPRYPPGAFPPEAGFLDAPEGGLGGRDHALVDANLGDKRDQDIRTSLLRTT